MDYITTCSSNDPLISHNLQVTDMHHSMGRIADNVDVLQSDNGCLPFIRGTLGSRLSRILSHRPKIWCYNGKF